MLAVTIRLVLDDGHAPFAVDRHDLRHAIVEELEGFTVHVRAGEAALALHSGKDTHLELGKRESVVIDSVEFDDDGGLTWEERTPQ
jgi:hypothetical protein